MAVQRQFGQVRDLLPRALTFLEEVRAELRKVHWPARRETYAATVVVLLIVAILASFLGLVDLALSQVVQFVLR